MYGKTTECLNVQLISLTALYFTSPYLFEQMQRRRTHEKLHIQGNIYPLSCASFIEDSKVRLTLLTQQPLGFSSLKSGLFFFQSLSLNYSICTQINTLCSNIANCAIGLMDIMLDRRLNQDDGYGLTQAVLDQVPTRSIFKLLLETFPVHVYYSYCLFGG